MKTKKFFKNNKDKIKRFCAAYSKRDNEGKVHCAECPYGDPAGYTCLFSKYSKAEESL